MEKTSDLRFLLQLQMPHAFELAQILSQYESA